VARNCRSWCWAWALLVSAASESPAKDEVLADLILKVGRIWTGDPDRPWAEAIASRSGELIAVGRGGWCLTMTNGVWRGK